MSRLKQFFKNHYWLMIAVVASLLLIILWFASLTENELLILFSSDALYLPSVYHDIFVNGNTVQGWTFNPAPNFLPDMLIFFLLMGITSNFITATFLFSVIQYFAIIFMFFAIFKQITSIKSSVFSLSLYLFSFFLLYFLVDNCFYYSFLIASNSYHNGVFFMTLLCIFLSLKFLKKESWTTLVFIFLITAIIYPCDRLFLVMYSAPVLFVSVILLITRENKKKILKFGLACILGLLVGMVIFDKFMYNSTFQLTKMYQFMNWEGIVNSWNIFASQMKDCLSRVSFVSSTIILSIISYIWTCYYCISQFVTIMRKKQTISPFFILEVFILAFVPMVALAPILNGTYLGYDVIRYNYFIFIVLLFNLILLSNCFLEKYQYITKGLNGVFASILLVYLGWNIATKDFISGFKSYFSTYTERTHNVDIQFPQSETAVYGITDNYWSGKHITMFSKKNIRLYVTFEDAVPYLHVVNRKWFTGDGNWKYANPQFTFLLWSTNLPLPDYFITQNPPYKSHDMGNGQMLHFVKPFVYDESLIFPMDKNELQSPKSK